jgi:hypothetical protein
VAETFIEINSAFHCASLDGASLHEIALALMSSETGAEFSARLDAIVLLAKAKKKVNSRG